MKNRGCQPAPASDRAYDFVTFDCYGTLIDWEAGISAAFLCQAAADGVTLQCDNVLALHAEIEAIVQQGAYRSYRQVLREVARQAAVRLGWDLDERKLDFLPDSLRDWTPFPDTRPALRRLRAAGYRLGILSNVDDDLLQATLCRLDVEFDLLVTAQAVRSYKPEPAHFLAARQRIGDARWIHAAQSLFHDVAPARRLGIPVAWIRRSAERVGSVAPDHEFHTLEAFADWLAGRAAD